MLPCFHQILWMFEALAKVGAPLTSYSPAAQRAVTDSYLMARRHVDSEELAFAHSS